jgi:hypothetical protein
LDTSFEELLGDGCFSGDSIAEFVFESASGLLRGDLIGCFLGDAFFFNSLEAFTA